jgi:wyosine [tRNA(Phe)-imidazoG37] synthetase (radical SAM superfamily)
LDFLSLVPDGEPTLDRNLGEVIKGLQPLSVKIAVITNGSLLWRGEVREGLGRADWVSLKVDTVREGEWRRINRPHPSLRMETVLRGMLDFATGFQGELVTETMLLAGVNDSADSIAETALFVEKLRPSTAYLGIPTRPTAERWAKSIDEDGLNRAYQLFSQRVGHVELLTGDGDVLFGGTGDVEADLVGITSVHPMSEDAVRLLLDRNGADWSVVAGLIDRGVLAEIDHEGQKFYIRRLRRVGKADPGS